MSVQPADNGHDPVTLHRVMQSMIAECLKKRYQPAQILSHELFVLLLQLKEREGRHGAVKQPRTRRAAHAKA
jgi:hypothetical protein